MSAATPWTGEAYVQALRLAAHWHRDQKVPGTELPYLVHLTSVCNEVQRAIVVEPIARPDVAVQGALLHDILEDTPMAHAALVAEVGPDVAAIVQSLSKNAELPKADQMADSLRRIREQPIEAWLIKLADRITNLAPPPSYWKPPKPSRSSPPSEKPRRFWQRACASGSRRTPHTSNAAITSLTRDSIAAHLRHLSNAAHIGEGLYGIRRSLRST
jgi:(p)ppGpp synthase/HD superfamily hydrolase